MHAKGSASIQATPEQLLDSAPDAIVIIDSLGAIRLVNRQAETLFGYRRDELINEAVEVLVPDRLRGTHPLQRAGYFSNPDTRPMGAGLELHARRKDGTEVPVDISLSSLETSEGLLVSAAIRDISERKAIEAKFQGLLEAAPDAIIAVDAEGIIHLANRQAGALFGYESHELVGQQLDLLVPDRVRPLHPRHRASYFEDPTPRPMGVGLELSARRRDGTEFPVDVSLSAFETEDGVLVSAAIRDVTDRKRVEQEQAELRATLEQVRLDEARAVLGARLHQAQRLESIGQLAGGVAHDFNNLLAGIMNYASLVSATLREELDRHGLADDDTFATITQDVEEITKVAKRGATLTHQLLIFSRREVVKPEVLDLNAIVADMQDLLGRTIGETIDLRTVLDPDLPRTRADRGQIEQVLMNLVVNARDAMPGGGGLEIRTTAFVADDAHLEAHGGSPGVHAVLVVSDTGLGMTDETARRVFEPFFSTKPRGLGSGLGLATVYGIVTQAGGTIELQSAPGDGTSVRVALPATTDDPAAIAEAALSGRVDGDGEIVLLVEDEEIVREPARRMLERHGYRVRTASNAREALAVATSMMTIDLLLTDVVMPGLSGKELAGRLAVTHPRMRVLFMSGYSEDIIAHEGVLDAGVDLIVKPFAADSLLRRVRGVLERS